MGVIFDIQRCCCDDGPGVRTTVFFKGCQLHCHWCHNPESFRMEPQLRYLSHQCTGCGSCAQICPQGAHTFQGSLHQVDFSACIGCGSCAAACPAGALELSGYETTAQDVMQTVLKDRVYYNTSGGGLTISGGEPTLQPAFLLELLGLAKEQGIHTCLETNGFIPVPLLQKLLNLVDLFLLDYKLTDSTALKHHTGASGQLWNTCLELLQQHDKPVILRLPVIPGINDTASHFSAAAQVARQHPCIRQVQIMPYHAIGAAKWEQLGYRYSLQHLHTATPEQTAAWQALLDSFLCAQLLPAVNAGA